MPIWQVKAHITIWQRNIEQMEQSMSHVGHYIDNCSVKGF